MSQIRSFYTRDGKRRPITGKKSFRIPFRARYFEITLPDEIIRLLEDLRSITPVYVVGGTVRETVRIGDFDVSDVDLAVNYDVEKLMEELKMKGYKVIPMGIEYGIIRVHLNDTDVDIGRFRFELYKKFGDRHPEVRPAESIHDDLSRRDFTINAMAFEYEGREDGSNTVKFKLIDPYGGAKDMSKGIIKAVGNPDERFEEDPLRSMRAIRFAAKYGFKIDEDTLDSIRDNA